MSELHLHLMITHVPVLGVIFGAVMIAWGLIRARRAVQEVGLVVLVLAGVAAGAAYVTGEGAEEAVESSLASDEALLERHEALAVAGLSITGLAAVAALIALASGRRRPAMSRPVVIAALAISVAASGTMAVVANLGGQIGHSEIRSGTMADARQGDRQGRERDDRHEDEEAARRR